MSTVALFGLVAAGLAAVVGIAKAGVPIVRFIRRIGHFVDDWIGEPARDGIPARPGVMARLENIESDAAATNQRVGRIEHELKPNGGSSLRDALDRVEVAVTDQTEVT